MTFASSGCCCFFLEALQYFPAFLRIGGVKYPRVYFVVSCLLKSSHTTRIKCS